MFVSRFSARMFILAKTGDAEVEAQSVDIVTSLLAEPPICRSRRLFISFAKRPMFWNWGGIERRVRPSCARGRPGAGRRVTAIRRIQLA